MHLFYIQKINTGSSPVVRTTYFQEKINYKVLDGVSSSMVEPLSVTEKTRVQFPPSPPQQMIFEPKNPIPVVTPMGDRYVRDSIMHKNSIFF